MPSLACDSSNAPSNPHPVTLGDTPSSLSSYVRAVLDRADAWSNAVSARVRTIERAGNGQVVEGGLSDAGTWTLASWRTGYIVSEGGAGTFTAAQLMYESVCQQVGARHITDVVSDLASTWPKLLDDPDTCGLPSSLAAALWRWTFYASVSDLAAFTGWTTDEVAARLIDAKNR